MATPFCKVAVGFSRSGDESVRTFLPPGSVGGQVNCWAQTGPVDRQKRMSAARFMVVSLLADDELLVGFHPQLANHAAGWQLHLDVHLLDVAQAEVAQRALAAGVAVAGR